MIPGMMGAALFGGLPDPASYISGSGATGTGGSYSLPAGAAAGDIIVAMVSSSSGAVMGGGGGGAWTQVFTNGGGGWYDPFIQIFYKVLVAGDISVGTFNVNSGGQNAAYVAVVYRGPTVAALKNSLSTHPTVGTTFSLSGHIQGDAARKIVVFAQTFGSGASPGSPAVFSLAC